MLHECTIGMLDDDSFPLVTKNGLEKRIAEQIEFNRIVDENSEYGVPKRIVYSRKQYSDRRYSTDLTRFNYCPDCGKKIDWKNLWDGEKNV